MDFRAPFEFSRASFQKSPSPFFLVFCLFHDGLMAIASTQHCTCTSICTSLFSTRLTRCLWFIAAPVFNRHFLSHGLLSKARMSFQNSIFTDLEGQCPPRCCKFWNDVEAGYKYLTCFRHSSQTSISIPPAAL